MSRRKKSAKTFIGIVVLILLLVLAVGGVVYLQQNGDLFSSWYIKYGNEKITENITGFRLNPGEKVEFKIVSFKNIECEFKLIPLSGANLEYVIDGTTFVLGDEDLAAGFEIETLARGFSLQSCGEVPDVLLAVHGGTEISFPYGVPTGDLFQLQVAADEKTITIDFCLYFEPQLGLNREGVEWFTWDWAED